MKGQLNFESDDFIKHVLRDSDPANPQPLNFMQGYLGESDKEDHIRLYFDPSLNRHTNIKKEDVVHLQKIPKSKHPLGGVMLWVKSNGLDHTHGVQQAPGYGYAQGVTQTEGHAHSHQCACSKGKENAAGHNYLQGNIYNQYLAQQQQQQPQGQPQHAPIQTYLPHCRQQPYQPMQPFPQNHQYQQYQQYQQGQPGAPALMSHVPQYCLNKG